MNLPELEKECPVCNGENYIDGEWCNNCIDGKTLTEEGIYLFQILSKHFSCPKGRMFRYRYTSDKYPSASVQNCWK